MTGPRIILVVAFANLLVAAGFGQPNPAPPSPKKLALIITNNAYRSPSLPSPADASGAQRLAAALKEIHFDVETRTDLDKDQLKSLFNEELPNRIHPGEIWVIYYCGYALQSKDSNYLVPVDFDPKSREQIYNTAYSLSRLIDNVELRKPQLAILVLDASWESRILTDKFGDRGLAPLTSNPESTVLFAAGPNASVPIGPGQPGLLTLALSSVLTKEGLTVANIQAQTRDKVRELSNGGQIPMTAGTPSEIVFRPRPAPPPKFVEVEKIVTKTETVIEKEPWPKPGSAGTNNKGHLDYVFIPKGTFKMGCVEESAKPCDDAEKPQHRKDFWMGQTEVTAQSYLNFVGEKKRKKPKKTMTNPGWKNPVLPIVEVTWEDAKAYCEYAGGRLPAEAEWEYAARGGVHDQPYPYSDPETSRDKANYMGTHGHDIYPELAPVKSFDANPWGLYDMAGNVWEWVSDYFANYNRNPQVDPQGPKSGNSHVARGGSYSSDPAKHLRISYRYEVREKANNIGFRCVLPDSDELRKKFRK